MMWLVRTVAICEVLRVAMVLEMLAKAESTGAEDITEIAGQSLDSLGVPRSGNYVPKMVRRGVMESAMGRSAETAVRAPVRAVKLAPDKVEVRFMGGMITWSTTWTRMFWY